MSQRICSIDDCERPVRYKAVGWCEKHYARSRAKGDPLAPSKRDSIAAKIARSVRKQDDGCWIWTGTFSSSGYGAIQVDGKQVLMHRYMLEHAGVDVEGLFACHHCDVRACVNPDHLYAGTNADNMRDRSERDGYVGYPGESNPFVKMTDEQVAEIRALYASGAYTQRGIARRFGIAQSHVGRIVRRESRKE